MMTERLITWPLSAFFYSILGLATHHSLADDWSGFYGLSAFLLLPVGVPALVGYTGWLWRRKRLKGAARVEALMCLLFPVVVLFVGVFGLKSGHALAGGLSAPYTRFAGFELGRDALSTVQSQFKVGTSVKSGDASSQVESLCYRHPQGSVSFLSGELGGTARDLMAFRLSALPPEASCAAWPPTVIAPDLTLEKLSVGMSRQAFDEAVVTAVQWQGSSAQLQFPSVDRKSGVILDVLVTVEAHFHGGRLHTLTVWRSATN